MAKGTRKTREPTRKQIAVKRRDREQRKWFLLALGLLAALVVGIGAVALVDQLILKPSHPVAIVNGVTVRLDAYQSRDRYERFMLDSFLQNLDRQLALIDAQEPTNDFLAQYYRQIADQTRQQRLGVDRQTADDMIEEELVRQKAAELGLSVTEAELNEAIRARIAGMSGFWTESQATAAASTAVAATATADTFTPTSQPTAALATTSAITSTPTVTPEVSTPPPTPTRHIITQDEFSQDYADYLSVLKEQTGLSESKYRNIVAAGLLVEKVRQYYADQVPAEAEQLNVSHIQVDTQEEAQAALRRLDAGEDFALVASEVSTDTSTSSNGGELGWVIRGDLESFFGPKFEETVFSLKPGEYSQPITSTFGVHIIRLNERGVRPLSEPRLSDQQQQAYSDWLQEARYAEGVQDLWQPDMAPPDSFVSSLPASGAPVNQTQ